MTATFVHEYTRTTPIIAQMERVAVDPSDPVLLRLCLAYQAQFKLGAELDLTEHLATVWIGLRYQGRLVAAFGERERDGTLEVTDAYAEPTRYGRIASCAMFLNYQQRVNSGAVEQIVFTVLWENKAMWAAVIRETKQFPRSLKFVLTKGAQHG